MITEERLKELLEYNPDTGIWKWIVKRPGTKINKVAGYFDGCYMAITIDYYSYRIHQLAFLYMRGYIPEEVDHKDTNKLNNKWYNLRESDKFKNSCNRGKNKNNTSGYKGVSWDKSTKKWLAQICIRGKRINLGCYDIKEDAAKAYNEAALKYHDEFANLNEME